MSRSFADTSSELQVILSYLQSQEDIKSVFHSKLTANHFGWDQMLTCYEIILKLAQSGGIPSLETFCQRSELDESTLDVLRSGRIDPDSEPVVPVTNENDANHLCTLLDESYKLRRIRKLVGDSAAKLKDDKITNEDVIKAIVSDIETGLFDLQSAASQEAEPCHIGASGNSRDLIKNLLDPEKQGKLHPSTFNNYDIMTGGFGRSDLVILASHAKGGKSIVALNMLHNMYLQHNLNVCYISFEMTRDEVAQRLASRISEAEHSDIRQPRKLSGADRKKANAAYDRFYEHGLKNNCRFTIRDPSTMTVSELKLKYKNHGYDVICVDYMNLMSIQEKNKADWERLSILGRELKAAAKELNCLIISPAQLNDDGEMRYSKAIKEHANVIWAWKITEEERATKMFKVRQLVTRSGPPEPFMLSMYLEHMTVLDGPEKVPDEFKSNFNKAKGATGKPGKFI